ncbi:PRC-barrel domain-containing protein [Paracoccus sp. p3-h83]|uniref:PRC-barrel domain-containing protein n=1 Tax=Paracoccus sp. p3-h83 TaxID=3342805 RepID=UPI0035B815C0
MKKFFASAAALSLIAGMATAQTATTTTEQPAPGMEGMAGMAGTAGTAGMDGMTGVATDAAPAETVVAPTEAAAAPMTEATHMLGSWIMDRNVWTTVQPAGTSWDAYTNVTERPAEWKNIANIDDIVIDADGKITGYVVDIGGFLGIGAKRVALDPNALRMMHIGDDTFFATHYTQDELKALPEFDKDVVKN